MLASNTSTLSVTELAATTRRAGRVLGLRWYSAVPGATLVEVTRTVLADPTVIDDVTGFVDQKIRAVAAHRSQYPIDPAMFPDSILREMFGVEYFIQVLPERELDASLLEPQSSAATSSNSAVEK